MHVRTFELCDFAQAENGKLTMVGAGWTIRTEGPAPLGIGLILELEWGDAGREQQFAIDLLDADGHPVKKPDGDPVTIAGGFGVVQAANHPAGVPLTFCTGFNASLPLGVGQYVCRLSLNGQSDPRWERSFACIPPQQQRPAA